MNLPRATPLSALLLLTLQTSACSPEDKTPVPEKSAVVETAPIATTEKSVSPVVQEPVTKTETPVLKPVPLPPKSFAAEPVKSAAQEKSSTPAPAPKNALETLLAEKKVSLDIKEKPLSEGLELLRKEGAIITYESPDIEKAVKGTIVTMTVGNMRLGRAINFLLNQNGFRGDVQEGVVIVKRAAPGKS